MKNLLINYISGDKFIENFDLEIYFKSLKKIKNADKFVLVNNISDDNIKKLELIYDKVIFGEAPFYYVYHLFYDILKQYGHDYEYTMYIDTRDVIIQKNPFDYMTDNPDVDLFLVCEGMNIEDNDINMYWHQLLKSTQIFHHNNSEKLPVVNGGTLGGKVKDVLYHLLLAITNANRRSDGVIPDQAIYSDMNYFMSGLKHVKYCHPYSSALCATGEAIKRNNIDIQFINGEACNMNNEPYYLFHQWDRTEFADEIRNKHKTIGMTFKI